MHPKENLGATSGCEKHQNQYSRSSLKPSKTSRNHLRLNPLKPLKNSFLLPPHSQKPYHAEIKGNSLHCQILRLSPPHQINGQKSPSPLPGTSFLTPLFPPFPPTPPPHLQHPPNPLLLISIRLHFRADSIQSMVRDHTEQAPRIQSHTNSRICSLRVEETLQEPRKGTRLLSMGLR